AILLVVTALIVSVYLISTFTMEKFVSWFAPLISRWNAWRERREQRKKEKIAARQARRATAVEKAQDKPRTRPAPEPPSPEEAPELDEIPICALEDTPPWEAPPAAAPAPPPPVQHPTSNIQHPVFRLPETYL